MIACLQLPPLVGRIDEQLQESLDAKREAAIHWMRERGIQLAAEPPPVSVGEWCKRYQRREQQ